MKKSIILITLMLTIITSTVFATNFKDLTESHWAYEPVMQMYQKGILNGYPDGTFAPSQSITRAEFAKILVLTLDLKENSQQNVFADVDPTFWGYNYIKIASNYLSGYTNGKTVMFLPNEAAVREDVAVAVVIASGLQDATYNLNTLNRFLDKDEISENFKKYVAIAVENNLMQGNEDGKFNTKGKLTRDEVCQLMVNATTEL